MNGHPVDKIELLVLGGTWSSYPHEYQEEFCRDLFYGTPESGASPGAAL
jgi:histone acetyltransferase (RNA polymerase elongator complex component)